MGAQHSWISLSKTLRPPCPASSLQTPPASLNTIDKTLTDNSEPFLWEIEKEFDEAVSVKCENNTHSLLRDAVLFQHF